MSDTREKLRRSRAIGVSLDESRAQDETTPIARPPSVDGRSLAVADLMLLQRTIGNRRVAGLVEGHAASAGSHALLQRQKDPGVYNIKEERNLRGDDRKYTILQKVMKGEIVDVKQPPPGRPTNFKTGEFLSPVREHSWVYHRASLQHGWVVDDNLTLIKPLEKAEVPEDSEDESDAEVTFEDQVKVLRDLVGALVTEPARLRVTSYAGAANAWTKLNAQQLTAAVNKADPARLLAADVVDTLTKGQKSPDKVPIIVRMIGDSMGDKMSVLEDAPALMYSTDWVAVIRDNIVFLDDFPKYFKVKTTRPPAAKTATTGRHVFFDY